MNWYNKTITANTVDPIYYIEYNPDISGWNMKVRFRDSNKVYTYNNVSPFVYESLENLRRKKNYSKVMKILKNLSKKTDSKTDTIGIQYTNIDWGNYSQSFPSEFYAKVTKEELDALGTGGIIESQFGVKPGSFDSEIHRRN